MNQIFATQSEGLLGNRSVILLGDFGQLPPVLDTPLFVRPKRHAGLSANIRHGLYNSFTKGVVLDQILRQRVSDDASDAERERAGTFRNALLHLRSGVPEQADIEFFLERQSAELPPDDLPNTVHLFMTNNDARNHNRRMLNAVQKATGLPVHTVCAVHNMPGLESLSEDDAGGLHSRVQLTIGAKVMLTANINVTYGLVNGAIGVVTAIGPTGSNGLPKAVLVKFDGYHGPVQDGAHGCVAIVPVERQWLTKKGQRATRTMLPLKLAWGVTIHKSQGLTLERVVVSLDGKMKDKLTLAFVAFSRVKKAENLFIRCRHRFQWPTKRNKALENEEKRIGSLGVYFFLCYDISCT